MGCKILLLKTIFHCCNCNILNYLNKNLAQRGYNTGHFLWLSLLVGLLFIILLSSPLVIFHFGCLPFWLSSILVVFRFGRLPFWSSCFWSSSFWSTSFWS